MKKILALAMALCMMLALVPFAFAESCDCGDPDCTEACTCEAATCNGDCCTEATEEESTNDFFQMLIDFFKNNIFNAIQDLIDRIIEAIGGPSLPF